MTPNDEQADLPDAFFRPPLSVWQRRWLVGLLFVATLVGLAVGLWSFWPYFQHEHRRLETWRIPFLWLGDLCSLAWFAWYFVSRFLLGVPLETTPDRSLGRGWILVLVSMVAALGVDVATTVTLVLHERSAFAHAKRTPADGEVVGFKRYGKDACAYVIECRFRDDAGNAWANRYIVRSKELPAFPVPALLAIEARRKFQLTVAYDPEFPRRSWLVDLGWDHSDGLHWFSLAVLMFQTMASVVFVLALGGVMRRTCERPWWCDLYMVVPLITEAGFFLLFGIIGRLVGNPPL